jgi:hypothetical protein
VVVATRHNTPQHTATHCNTLQHPLVVATRRNTPQHTATHRNIPLLLGHLLLIFTSQINTLLGKIVFVWIFVNGEVK